MVSSLRSLRPGFLVEVEGGLALSPGDWLDIDHGMVALERLGSESAHMPPRASAILQSAVAIGQSWRSGHLPTARNLALRATRMADGINELAAMLGEAGAVSLIVSRLRGLAGTAHGLAMAGQAFSDGLGSFNQSLQELQGRALTIGSDLVKDAAASQQQVQNMMTAIRQSEDLIAGYYRTYRRLWHEVNSKPGLYAIPFYGQVRLGIAIDKMNKAKDVWVKAKAEQARRQVLLTTLRGTRNQLQSQARLFSSGAERLQLLAQQRVPGALRATRLIRGAFDGLGSDMTGAAEMLANLDPTEADRILLSWDVEDAAVEWQEIRTDAQSFLHATA